jgi:hypothetical protein
LTRTRFVLALSLAFGLACGGAGTTDEPTDEAADKTPEPAPEPEKEVVVVPVPGADGGEHWCCTFEEAGEKKFALVADAEACNAKYADRSGRWTEGPECTPCCCKSPLDTADASKGDRFELTTATACAPAGTCLAADAKECKDGGSTPAPEPGEGKAGKGGKGKGKAKNQ